MPNEVLPLQVLRQLPPVTRATAITLTSAARTALRVEDVLGPVRRETPSQAVYFGYAGETLNNAVAA